MSALHVVQVIIDDSSNKTITGIWEFDRALGGVLIIASGSSLPASGTAGEIFWNSSDNVLYRRDNTNMFWQAAQATNAGADAAASYVLVNLTGSLPNSRYITGSSGITVTDNGPSGSLVISETQPFTSQSHAALRQLIHLSDGDGPYEAFPPGAVNDTGPIPFSTASIWYTDASRTKKIVEKNVVRNSNKTPMTIQWKVYDSNGVTVLATATDAITYSGVFETSRTRTIT